MLSGDFRTNLFNILLLLIFTLMLAPIPFLEKKVLKIANQVELNVIVYLILGFISSILSLIYLSNFKKIWQKIDNNNLSIILIIAFFKFIAVSILYYILSQYDATLIAILKSSILIIVTGLLATYIFNENVTKQMWLGMIITIIGLIVFLNGHTKKIKIQK